MIYESALPFPGSPDDLSLAQFILDSTQFGRPIRPPNHPWLIDNDSGIQYDLETCRRRTNALANALKSRFNPREDEVVVIYSPNHIDYPIAVWACHRLGLIVSGANPSYTLPELAYQLRTAKASLLITQPGSLDVAIQAANESGLSSDKVLLFEPEANKRCLDLRQLVEEGQSIETSLYTERKFDKGEGKRKVAFLSFSSGTTGRPKAVVIPHASVIANIIQVFTFNGGENNNVPFHERRLRPGDTVIGVLPLYHIYGLVVNLHWSLFTGLAVVIVPKFDFQDMMKSIERYRITQLMVVPPMVLLMCKHPAAKKYDLSSLRYILVGAAPLTTELTHQFTNLFPHIMLGQGYGMTETSTAVIMHQWESGENKAGSAGKLISGVQAKLLTPEGLPARPGESGELYVRSPSNALCYGNDAKATKETFIDGWVRTGDEVCVDDEGYFFITDRIKEIFKVRGFQVAPAELEGLILEHQDVADCAVIGIPDTYSGSLPMAFVCLNEKARLRAAGGEANVIKESIKKHVADAKVRYKHLDGGVEFIDAIPKNPSGKLLRRVLRDLAHKMMKERGRFDSEFGAKSKL